MLQTATVFLATLGPIGQKCRAPGTFGSLAGVIAVLFVSWLIEWPLAHSALLFIPLIVIGVPICTIAEEILGKTDPGEIIWDEFTAMPIVFIGLPASISFEISWTNLIWVVIGFIFFRIFDILKPLGINRIQHLKSGFGVMIDDVLAAAYAAILLYLTFTFSLSFF
jgi:phosphatidylglycerophosphatase A